MDIYYTICNRTNYGTICPKNKLIQMKFCWRNAWKMEYSLNRPTCIPRKQREQMAGTISRKVCARYNGRRWLPCQNHSQPMWDIAALLTAIDTFPICYQTTPVDLTVARPFRRVPVRATTKKEEEERKEKEEHVAINAAFVKQWSHQRFEKRAFIIIVENPRRARVLAWDLT